MTTLTLSFDGVYEQVLESMLRSKMAKTKSEAVRMALLYFGMRTGAVKNNSILDSIRADLARDRKTFSAVEKEIQRVKDETVCR